MITIAYSYFSLKDMHALAGQLVTVVNQAHGADGVLRAATERVEKQMKLTQQMLADSPAVDITSALAEADQQRDDGFMALRDTIAACLRRLNPDIRRSAERLFPVFGRNDAQLHVLPYGEQTEAMNRLFADLEIDQFKKDIDTLGVTEALQELKEAQAHFVYVYEVSLSPDSKDEEDDIRARSELKGALEVLVSVLNTLTALNKVDGISKTAAEITRLVGQATRDVKG